MADTLTLKLDTAQRRLWRDRLQAIVQGAFDGNDETAKGTKGWSDLYAEYDGNGDAKTWVDPITARLMLMPLPLTKGWRTSGTGAYARLLKANLTFNDSSKWIDVNQNGQVTGVVKLKDASAGSADRAVITSASWPKNRGFYVRWFVASSGSEKTRIECGWNSSPSYSAGVALRVYSDAKIEIYKAAQFVGQGELASTSKNAPKADGQWMGLLLIPIAKNELLIVTDTGAGYSHVFDDIADDDPDPTITDATNFWFYVPEGDMQVEVAPLRYQPSGYRCGVASFLDRAPEAGRIASVSAYADLPGYGAQGISASLRNIGDTADFVANGVQHECRVRMSLSSDGESTPFVSGAAAAFDPEFIDTDDSEETDLLDWCVSASLSVPEDPSGVQLDVTLRSPDEIDPGDVRGLLTVSNRPFSAAVGSVQIIDGVTMPVASSEAVSDEARRVEMSVRTKWKLLENYRFSSRIPLDGMSLRDAFILIAKTVYADEELEVEDFDYEIPSSPGASGEWSTAIEVGDSAADWMQRLHESYAATAFMGEVPTASGIVLRIASPESLDESPRLTLYLTDEEALDALASEGFDQASARRRLFTRTCRRYRETNIENEANEIFVTGFDSRTFRPIVVRLPDLDSQDPTLAPSLRPDNWLGEVRKYGWVDPNLRTADSCRRAARLLAKRLTVRRVMAEIECELMIDPLTGVPLWRGDVVEIAGKGSFRIVSLTCEFHTEPGGANELQWRDATYCLERIVDGTSRGCGFSTLAAALEEFEAFHLAGMASKTVYNAARGQEAGLRRMQKRPPLSYEIIEA